MCVLVHQYVCYHFNARYRQLLIILRTIQCVSAACWCTTHYYSYANVIG